MITNVKKMYIFPDFVTLSFLKIYRNILTIRNESVMLIKQYVEHLYDYSAK